MDARLTALLAAGIVLLALAVPALAGAATVGAPVERSAPARYPETFAGCRPACRAGKVMARGHIVVSRRVRLDAGERQTRVRFVCRPRYRLMTFGAQTRGDIFPQIPESEVPYTNRRAATVIAERGLAPVTRPSNGTIYAVCRRA